NSSCDQRQLPPQDEPEDEVAERQADESMVEEHPVPTVGLKVTRVATDGRLVPRDPAVHDHIAELHGGVALEDRGVRIALDVGEGVMLAVHGHPLAGPDTGCYPGQQAGTD